MMLSNIGPTTKDFSLPLKAFLMALIEMIMTLLTLVAEYFSSPN
jgi:hypothetical protein